MTDFYALLKQSILDRGIRNENDRREVYAQARRAVVKQLWDYRPPLAADEIDMRVGTYDTAVERIEAELQSAFASGAVMRPKARQAAARAAPEPARQPQTGRQPQSARQVEAAALAAQLPDFTGWSEEEVRAPRRAERVPARQAPDEETYDEQTDTYIAEEAPEPPRKRRRSRNSLVGQLEASTDRSGPEWLGWLGTAEQARIRLLAIAAGGLFVVVVGVVSFILGANSRQTVTAPAITRQVSDASTAARIPNDPVKVVQSFSIFDGRDPTVFATTPDNPVNFDNTNGFARVTSSTSAPGVKVTIAPGLADSLAGKNVRVVIVARSSLEAGAANMRFAYQSGLAISHWQPADLGSDYAAAGLEWRVPAMRTNPAGDFLLIEPGIPGDGTGVDIKSVRIDVLAS